MRTFITACAPICLLLPQVAQGQDIIELHEIVASATIAPLPINRTGATVDVLDGEDLAEGPISVAGALDRVPGTSISANGGVGANTTLRVRGLDGKYLGVLIDGIDVTDPSSTQTQFNFGGLTGAGLDRIELVKGSQSALYGSEAVAGVIDITSYELAEDGRETRVGVEAGSFGTVSASVGHAIRDGNTALSFNLSQVRTEGFSARSSDTEDDGFEQTFLTLKGQTELGEGVIVGASALYRDAEIEIDRSTTDSSGENLLLQRGARVFTIFDAFGFEHELSFSSFDVERRDPGGFIAEFNGDRDEVSYRGTTETRIGTLSFGLDRSRESFETSSDSGSSVTESALVELQTQPSADVDVAVSLRYDDNEDFGDNLSGRLALAWQVTPDTTVRAVAGNGFRAPSLFERFSGYGDTSLQVEASRSFELGVEHRWSDARVEATAFYTEIDDLISYDFGAVGCAFGPGCYNQVPGTTVSKGIEIAGEAELRDGLTLFGAYTYTDAETDGVRLVRVPRHDFLIGVDADLTDRLSAHASLTHVADVEPSDFAPVNNKVGDYTLVNLGLGYQVSDNAEAYIRVENVFAEDYETAGGFNTAGRSFFAGLRASF